MPGMWIYIKSPSRWQAGLLSGIKARLHTVWGRCAAAFFACPAGARITVRLARFPKALRSGTGSQAV